MKLNNVQFFNTNFKGATLNINAISDTHGQLSEMGSFWGEVEKHKEDLFLKEEKGKKNVLAVSGDWFMAGSVRGYQSRPDFNSQNYQTIFFNRLIQQLKKYSKSMITIFTPGNHDFDAGVEEFAKSAKKMPASFVATNINYDNSPLLSPFMTKSKVVEIEDDKDPNLVHKALFLGIVPTNMSYYNKKLQGVEFSDNVFKPQLQLTDDDAERTFSEIQSQIEQFKKQNPNGAVIILDHLGGVLQERLLREKLDINVILSGHEHLDFEKYQGSTLITKLFQNFRKFQNIKINFDDNGKIENIKSRAYYPQTNHKPNEMDKFYQRVFKNDLETTFKIPAQEGLEELSLKGVKYQNSPLANFIVDVLLLRTKKQMPDTDFFALNASAIRGPLITENIGAINNTNLLLTLNGIKEDDAEIVISEITGEELLEVILENLLTNKQNPDRNPLTHYGNLKINKTLLLYSYEHGIDKKYLTSFLERIDTGEKIEPEKKYKVANVEKFFKKCKNQAILSIFSPEKNFYTGLNAKEEFKNYFQEGGKSVVATDEARIF